MNDATISGRAVKAIKSRCKNPKRVGKELAKLDIPRSTYDHWMSKGYNPNAYYLQQMALQGYDIYYILTGETKHEN